MWLCAVRTYAETRGTGQRRQAPVPYKRSCEQTMGVFRIILPKISTSPCKRLPPRPSPCLRGRRVRRLWRREGCTFVHFRFAERRKLSQKSIEPEGVASGTEAGGGRALQHRNLVWTLFVSFHLCPQGHNITFCAAKSIAAQRAASLARQHTSCCCSCSKNASACVRFRNTVICFLPRYGSKRE